MGKGGGLRGGKGGRKGREGGKGGLVARERDKWRGRREEGGAHRHHEVATIQSARASGFVTIPPPPPLPELGQHGARMLPGQAAAAPQRRRACERAHGTSAHMAWQEFATVN